MFFRQLDWVLIFSALMLVFLGLVTMKTFNPAAEVSASGDYFFQRQLIWAFVGILAFLFAVFVDWSFLKTNSIFLFIIYLILTLTLLVLLITVSAVKGAASWFQVSSVSIEPVEIMKPVLVLLLAKYFSKRHVEMGRFIHLIASSFYVGIPTVFVVLQPDMGSALILGGIWLGMAFVSGIKIRHLFYLLLLGIFIALTLWIFFLLPYQKARILSFVSPESDIRGASYQALQSVIAIGSGQILGKGIGFGTQSRLEFLPEHTTDFIFAAFAEEWGLLGMLIIFFFFGIVIWRILRAGIYGESNFEKLYASGLAILLFLQASIHMGMNAGILPITGLGMPFLSYGGSSLISLFIALGILESFSLHKKGIYIGTEERYREGIMGV